MNTKPISSIKEVNNDGTYIIKEVFEKTTFHRGFLSRIKKYNSDKIWLSGETFKDKEFSELYYDYQITYKNENYQIKAIHKEAENGVLSFIEEYNKDDKILSGKAYKDKEFKILSETCICTYNPDGSYQKKGIFEELNNYGYTSFIEEYNKDDKILSGKYFKDKEFKILSAINIFTHNSDGSYQLKGILEEPNNNEYLSFIEEYNKEGKILNGKYFKDKEFSELYCIYTCTYNADGSHQEKTIDYELEFFYIEQYNKNNKVVKKEYFKDKEFKILSETTTYTYPEGSHKTKTVFEQPDNYGNMSCVREYDKDNKLLTVKGFKDKEFSKLVSVSVTTYIYNKGVKTQTKTVCKEEITRRILPHTNICVSGVMSETAIGFHDKSGELKLFKDKKFSKLIGIGTEFRSPDYSRLIKIIYEKADKDGNMSFIVQYNSNREIIDFKSFKDKEFKILNYTKFYTYNPDGSYQVKTVFEKPNNYGHMSVIEEYNKDDKILSGKYFKDKESKILSETYIYTYNPDGSYQRKRCKKTYI